MCLCLLRAIWSNPSTASKRNFLKANFYFWRDNNDLEVDLLWEEMGKLRIAEIKSSETVHDNFFVNMHKFAKSAAPTAVVPFLFYGGDAAPFEHLGTQVLGWRSAHRFLE